MSEQVPQRLAFYLPEAQAPAGSKMKSLSLRTGKRVRVAIPAIASVSRSEVLGVRGLVVPVEVEPSARPFMKDPHLYRIVLDATPTAQRKLQRAIDLVCASRADVQIALGETIIDHVVVLGCGKYEPGVTFVDRSAAEQFALDLAGKRVRFALPTPAAIGDTPTQPS